MMNEEEFKKEIEDELNHLESYVMNVKDDEPEKYVRLDYKYILKRLEYLKKLIEEQKQK